MSGPMYNPATAADTEQHAQEEIADSDRRSLRRPAARAGLAAAGLASAWLVLRRLLRGERGPR
jgi:hypothetical protein